eukprot:TRINITY_DN28101_c0_g1_i1.p1 TRINITY_DN28101_c0_g1~~TRINITY_DN28101_c0_g1_i1.p1  ORF type:complete len:373 (+),score=131.40 TRINITY_DN28101_c0_g1_i1:79-1197(+)
MRPPSHQPGSRGIGGPLLVLAFAAVVLFNLVFAPAQHPEQAASAEEASALRQGHGAGEPRRPGPLRFVTILSEPRKYHCTMLASAALLNITVHVFAWGDTRLHGVVGWWRKLLWFKALLRTFDDDDIVMFFDAGDCLLNARPEAVLAAYERVVREQQLRWEHEFVWSAERNCGMKTLTKEQCRTLHNVRTSSPYRWLNTGGWIGRAKVGRHIFDVADRDRAGRTNDADQSFVAEAHVRHGWKHLHGIDSEQRVFMSVYLGWRDLCGWPGNLERPLRNCVTGSRPAALHFNAGAKDEKYWNPIKAATEWAAELDTPEGKRKAGEHAAIVNGRSVPIARICPTGYGLVADGDVKRVRRMIDLGEAERSHIDPGG